MKINKEWCLPRPPKGQEVTWHPVVRLGHHVPFGYKEDPEDKDVLLPIPKELELMELAKKHVKRYGYRETADWLTQESGRKISHEGLRKRIKLERRRQKDFANAKLYAEKAKAAAEKAEKIANSLGGPNTRDYSSD